MSKPASVFFTGMEAFDAEQLIALFHDINRRSGNRWTIAPDAESAGVLVIDVDTLYGHMTWLRATNSGQTVIALTTGTSAEADHVLQRPVTAVAMRRLFNSIASGMGMSPPTTSASTTQEPESENASPPETEAVPAIESEQASPLPPMEAPPSVESANSQESQANSESPAEASAPTDAPRPAAAGPVVRKLIDVLLANDLPPGPHQLELPGQPPLVLDVEQKHFFCGNSIKRFLPYTQIALSEDQLTPLPETELQALEQTIGEPKPLSRLLWLAALGASDGEVPAGAADSRYRLTKWPQIEREFPKHFRIATAMMKGFQTPDELAEQSGASRAEICDFISASLISGHAEIDVPQAQIAAGAPAPRTLLERLRGAR